MTKGITLSARAVLAFLRANLVGEKCSKAIEELAGKEAYGQLVYEHIDAAVYGAGYTDDMARRDLMERLEDHAISTAEGEAI